MILQVALDFVDLDRALKIGGEVQGSADWLEAGTPLIKACGVDCVRALKKEFPGKKIVADLKIADTGDIETEIAAKAGADVVTVLGAVDDQTIIHAVEAAKNFGCEVMVDLLNVREVESQARRVEELGADYVMVHTGIDQQMLGKEVFEDLRNVAGSVDIPVAAGGGLTAENAARAVEGGAEILIVGGAITKAPDAGKMAGRFARLKKGSRARRAKGGVKKTPAKSIGEILGQVSASNLSDAMHRKGEMRGLRPVSFSRKFYGKAFTVRAYPGDWSKTVQSIDSAEEGDVIVIDAHESQVALWGELATRSALSKGIAGLVIDGGVRDIREIRDMDFPVFARCISPAAGEPKGMGELKTPIRCGGQEVEPGDYVLADEDGVVVLPKKRAYEIAKRALYVKEKEDRVRKEIDEGSTLGRILELGKWEKV